MPVVLHHDFPNLPGLPPQVVASLANSNMVVDLQSFDWTLNPTDFPVNFTVTIATIPNCIPLLPASFSTQIAANSSCGNAFVKQQSPLYYFNNIQQFGNTKVYISSNVNYGPYQTGIPDNGDGVQNGIEGDFIRMVVDINLDSDWTWDTVSYHSDFLPDQTLVGGSVVINWNGTGFIPVPVEAFLSPPLAFSLSFLSGEGYFNSTVVGKRFLTISYASTISSGSFGNQLVSITTD